MIAAVCAFGTADTFAQTVPSSAEPGRIEKHFEEPVAPKSVLEPVIPELDGKPLPPEKASEIKLTLQGVIFEGRTALPETELVTLYEPLLGKDVTLLEVYELADAVTAAYRNAGYILSRAIVPPQRIKSGMITIRIVEGYINRVIIEGEQGSVVDLLDTYADKIQASRPLHIDDLERYLLLANDIPGISAQSVLRPAPDTPGAANLVLKVALKPVDAALSLDNRGSRYVGPYQVTASVAENTLLGGAERTNLRVVTANPLGTGQRRELAYANLSHRRLIGDEGTSIGVSLGYSRSQPGHTLKVQEVKGRSLTLGITGAHPFIRTRGENLSAQAGLSYSNARTDLLGERLSEDKLRSASLGLTYDFIDRFSGITLVGATLVQGLPVLGSTDRSSANPSRADGRDDFTKITARASRVQKISGPVNLLVAASGQVSADALLSAEEFGIGGSEFGRGYDASEVTGEHGIAAKVELQYGRAVNMAWLQNYQAYAFYDVGAVWNKGTGDRDSLASGGTGVRVNLNDALTATAEVAAPLTRDIAAEGTGGDDPRVFFSLTMRY